MMLVMVMIDHDDDGGGDGRSLLLQGKKCCNVYCIKLLFYLIHSGLQFRLTLDKEFDEIEYSPNPQSPGSEDVLLNLPKYLQENIFFGADQAPRFLAKLLKTAE